MMLCFYVIFAVRVQADNTGPKHIVGAILQDFLRRTFACEKNV